MRGFSGYHVPRTQVNLTDEFAASTAAGVNLYGIFQDEMPWLGNAIRIYSKLQELCRKNCSNECGICRIRKKVNLKVHQLLKEDELSEHCRTDEGSCLHFQEQIP